MVSTGGITANATPSEDRACATASHDQGGAFAAPQESKVSLGGSWSDRQGVAFARGPNIPGPSKVRRYREAVPSGRANATPLQIQTPHYTSHNTQHATRLT